MKFSNLFLLLSILILVSCQEKAPRDRPYVPLNSQIQDDPTEDPPEVLTRPLDGISIKDPFCACNNGASIIFSNASCSTFCANKATSGEDLLFLDFSVSDEVGLSDLKTARAWCETPYNETQNVACIMSVKSIDGEENPIEIEWITANKAKVNISNLTKDKVYVFTPKITGEDPLKVYKASNTIQINKPSANPPMNLSPLPVIPVNQYTCLLKVLQQDSNTGDIYSNQTLTYHFYFIDRAKPDPIPAGTSNFLCHDTTIYGVTDEIRFPRLQQTAGAFGLWDSMDARFIDLDQSGKRDIDEIIKRKINDLGLNLTTTPELFSVLNKMATSTDNTQAGNTNLELGWYMKPWIGSDGLAFCPNQTHYYSANQYFIALRDIIGIDTEALYLAKKEPEAQNSSDGSATLASPDHIYIREADVKRAWFYLRNNVATQPLNATTIRNNQIMFYYPFDFSTPYIKKSTQKTYTIVSLSDTSPQSSTGIPTTLPPHDKRVGCVPKVGP